MKVTAEEINGKLCTVVWCVAYTSIEPAVINCGDYFLLGRYMEQDDAFRFEATALPALPRHPKPEDAPLLYRYMAEGMMLMGLQKIGYGTKSRYVEKPAVKLISESYKGGPREITHAINSETGERVEVAIV